jgi:hypothetical protein
MLACGGRVTSALIRRQYGVSRATAKRDMALLADHYPTRSLPGVSRGPHPQRILRGAA